MTTAEFNKDGILARVKKMMTLANDAAATEGERDNALRMAHATLAKYNLTMAEADASGKTPEEKREDGATEIRDYPWMRSTAYAIAKLFFCECFVSTSSRKTGKGKVKMYYVGKASNVFTAVEMTKYVIASIDKEGKREAKIAAAGYMTMSESNFWRSFCKGAAAKVAERCLQIRRSAEGEKTPGTALVLASVYQSEQVANKNYIATVMGVHLHSTRSSQRNTAHDAYGRGQEYGSKIGLHSQVTGKGTGAKLIK